MPTDAVNELLVDLDLVEREGVQGREGRESGSKIVHGDARAHGLQTSQGVQGGLLIGDEGGFGDFQHQTARGEAGLEKGLAHLVGQIGLGQLHGRQVDRDGDVLRPGRGLQGGGAQHPVAQFQDQAFFFGHRDKEVRRNHAPFGVTPAGQGFEAADLLILGPRYRLIEDFELPKGQGFAQVPRQGAAVADLFIHVGLKETVAVAAPLLGAPQGDVGRENEAIGVRAVLGIEADPGADPGFQFPSQKRHRRADRRHQEMGPFGQRHIGLTRLGGARDDEFVAAQPRRQVPLADEIPDAPSHLDQHGVAGRLAIEIIDQGEAIKIERHHPDTIARAVLAGDFLLQTQIQRPAVRKAGQRVVIRQIFDVLFRRPLGAQVAQRDDGQVFASALLGAVADKDLDRHRFGAV